MQFLFLRFLDGNGSYKEAERIAEMMSQLLEKNHASADLADRLREARRKLEKNLDKLGRLLSCLRYLAPYEKRDGVEPSISAGSSPWTQSADPDFKQLRYEFERSMLQQELITQCKERWASNQHRLNSNEVKRKLDSEFSHIPLLTRTRGSAGTMLSRA